MGERNYVGDILYECVQTILFKFIAEVYVDSADAFPYLEKGLLEGG
jgi:hypothetical protein